MAENSFESDLTQEQWLASNEWVLSGENWLCLSEHLGAMWRSRPWGLGKKDEDRKLMLLMVALYREVEPLIIHPEGRELLRVAELFADDGALEPLMVRADDAVNDLMDRPHAGDADEQRALEVVSWIWCKPTDAAVGPIAELAGALHARRLLDANNRERQQEGREAYLLREVNYLRCVFGNPFRPVAFDPAWRTETAVALAAGIYEHRAFDRLPVLVDALEDAGCGDPAVLAHCRDSSAPHTRGCWVVDLVLNK